MNASVLAHGISREELEYYEKFQQYVQIQKYEQMIHQMAIDPELYGELYFMKTDDNFLQLQSDLLMVPFKP